MSSPAQTLQELIDKAMIKQQVKSSNGLARIARAAGYQVVHTTIAAIKAGTYPWTPAKPTLEALAYLAGVPLVEAQRAAGLSDRVPYKPPENADLLTARQRDAVNGVIRAFVEASGGEGTAPCAPPGS